MSADSKIFESIKSVAKIYLRGFRKVIRFFRMKRANTLCFQKQHWVKLAVKEDSKTLSFAWGDPEKDDDPHGNYKKKMNF